jgi:hypothetical protein
MAPAANKSFFMTAKIFLSNPNVWLDLQDWNTVINITDDTAVLELHMSHENFARVATLLSRSVIASAAVHSASATSAQSPSMRGPHKS